jgi:hypothetical protein
LEINAFNNPAIVKKDMLRTFLFLFNASPIFHCPDTRKIMSFRAAKNVVFIRGRNKKSSASKKEERNIRNTYLLSKHLHIPYLQFCHYLQNCISSEKMRKRSKFSTVF